MLRFRLAFLMILLAAPAYAGSRFGGGFHGGGFHGGGFHGGFSAFHRSGGRARGFFVGYGYGYNCGFGFDCGGYDYGSGSGPGYRSGSGYFYSNGPRNAVSSVTVTDLKARTKTPDTERGSGQPAIDHKTP